MESVDIFKTLGIFEERLEELIALKKILEDKNRILCDKLDRLETQNTELIEFKDRSQKEKSELRARLDKLVVRLEQTIDMAQETK